MTVDFEKILSDSGMPTTESQVRAEFNAIVKEEGLITNTSNMSPFWRLITALVIKPYIYLKDVLINNVFVNMFLMTAQDWALDLYGEGVNLTRKESTATTGFITFTKSDISKQVVIKAGVIIQSPPINGHVYQLKTIDDSLIASGILSSQIAVVAVDTGASYNLAAGYYRILAEEIDNIESVNNDDNWIATPGADREAANDYRERIRNQYNFVGHYHTDAVYRGIISTITGISTNQIYFVHDAPRGPGTANVFLLLDAGVASDEFIELVNDYIMTQDNHGHGDDLRCFAMPESAIGIKVKFYFSLEKMPTNIDDYMVDVENFIRCAFRQNRDYEVTKVNAYSRFSISNLDRELHQEFNEIHSIVFSIGDIVSELDVPRLAQLIITYAIAEQ